ncbi:MAG: Vps62-related protein, partial [Acidimicrobiia bacterium]|nr:Vps62-related protein [Acidimicrobiia bacterium]
MIGRRTSTFVVTVLLAALVAGPLAMPAAAQDSGDETPDAAQMLAERYAPVMMLKAQEFPCDTKGEMYAPTSVDIVLDNPEILLRQVSIDDPPALRGPTAADLFGLGEGFFLDFPGDAVDPGCLYEKDFDKYSGGQPALVYAHIARQDDQPGVLALQYWFYWYFNEFNNLHESDWEGIQLLFEASTVEEALTSEPIEVAYAQHEGGEVADWDDAKLERDGLHPVVYSSRGSHASYFRSALYLGRRGNQGFGCDNTDGPSKRLDPDVVVLPDAVTDPGDPLAWLAYGGRWGERRPGSFNGPTGPLDKERWTEPVDWQNGLRSSSVVIPTGDSQASSTISFFCSAVTWGSGVMIKFTQSPARILLTLGLLFVAGSWVVHRTDWSTVPALPIRRRRRAGQIIRAAAKSYRRSLRALVTFGAIYVPTAVVVAFVGALVAVAPFVGSLRDLAGASSGTSLMLGIFAGSAASAAAYVAVNAMVAVFADNLDTEQPISARDAARLAWARRGHLASGFVRAYAIVLVLSVSVVGIPWGIRQMVRYQFLAQAIMLDGCDGKQGLRRSSELVEGRWWHTAVVVGAFNAFVAGSGLVFGLTLLLVLP